MEVGEKMNNVLAAKVLMSHLPEITDGAYKTATEIAIMIQIFIGNLLINIISKVFLQSLP